jgi:hypothetical protein
MIDRSKRICAIFSVILLCVAIPLAAEPSAPVELISVGGAAPSGRTAAVDWVPRWRVSELLGPIAHRGFDPALHTPSFGNDLAVYSPPLPYDLFNSQPSLVYHGGICTGICELTQLYYQMVSLRIRTDEQLERDFQSYFFPGAAVPQSSHALADLRTFTQDPERRRLAAQFCAAAQLDPTPTTITPESDPGQLVMTIKTDLQVRGLSRLALCWRDRDTGRYAQSHAILVYAVHSGVAVTAGPTRANSSTCEVLRYFDPNRPHPTNPAATVENPLQDSLIFFPQRRVLTLTKDTLDAYNRSRENRRVPLLQASESLLVGPDIFRRSTSIDQKAAMLRTARTTTRRTNVAHHERP